MRRSASRADRRTTADCLLPPSLRPWRSIHAAARAASSASPRRAAPSSVRPSRTAHAVTRPRLRFLYAAPPSSTWIFPPRCSVSRASNLAPRDSSASLMPCCLSIPAPSVQSASIPVAVGAASSASSSLLFSGCGLARPTPRTVLFGPARPVTVARLDITYVPWPLQSTSTGTDVAPLEVQTNHQN